MNKQQDAVEYGYFSKMAEAGFSVEQADELLQLVGSPTEKQAIAPLLAALPWLVKGGIGLLGKGLAAGGAKAALGGKALLGKTGLGWAGRGLQSLGRGAFGTGRGIAAAQNAGQTGAAALLRGAGRGAGTVGMGALKTVGNPYFVGGAMASNMMSSQQPQQPQQMPQQMPQFDQRMQHPQLGQGMQAAMGYQG